MTDKEIMARIRIVLKNMDDLSKSGSLRVNGLSAIQVFGGCVGILEEIANVTEKNCANEQQSEIPEKDEQEQEK